MKILLLAGNTLRSRCYAQELSNLRGVELQGIFYGFASRNCEGAELDLATQLFLKKNDIAVPDLYTSLEATFDKNSWQYQHVANDDVNSNDLLGALRNVQADLIIFSGYGGQILKPAHFIYKVPYLHMHPGALPDERGSTTIYYSILQGRPCTVSAFFMTAEIDSGTLVLQQSYSVPDKGVNIDKWYDNCIRADCMSKAIHLLLQNGLSYATLENLSAGGEYFVIHPLLKHIAILSLEKENQ